MGFDRAKGLVIVFGFIFILAIGFSLMGYNWFTHVDSTGNLKDSPFFYIILLVAIAFVALFLKSKSQAEAGGKISVAGFVNVAVSGVAIGGIIHEFVHVLLLNHATQLRLHFGDPTAIFSTCCLVPGELANEEIAYAVQFLVTIAWVIYFENIYYNSNEKYSTKKSIGNPNNSAKNNPNKSIGFPTNPKSLIASTSILSKDKNKKISGEVNADELDENPKKSRSSEREKDEDDEENAHVSNRELSNFLGELEKTKVKSKKK